MAILLNNLTAFAQISPVLKTRSDASFTQSDAYLSVIKRLGIPTSSTDDLNASIAGANTAKLVYNTTLQKLRIYNPITDTWKDASPADLSNFYTKSEVDHLISSISLTPGPKGDPATVPSATIFTQGKIRLSGDLEGTADSPIVRGLDLKANLNQTNNFIADQNITGALTVKQTGRTATGNFYTSGEYGSWMFYNNSSTNQYGTIQVFPTSVSMSLSSPAGQQRGLALTERGLLVQDYYSVAKGLEEIEDYSANKTAYSYVTKLMLDRVAVLRGTGIVAPASATATGVKNEVRLAGGYLYWCTDTDKWVRTAFTSW
ncbi:hypothetical protein TH53_13550 [Pedobacter lusitanus]|uniref:Uncharacterized protein n=2 Tax=Pedobacter lusitanus TaxID=1503925 RepID=A0A0D0GKH8_9SPHI|nr:hypothetical protein TH53_13550 [Pedobacter lusitanus]